ncbi:hypothetical protein KUTeg_013198 [Tegillarca granosa]|uniref:Uncharacterized protein n=1 Tax=Tegillarca granosa TaxID=220873 RepID=A0ABQ9ETD6_TEGGR|nr:hypothetical protein KUTeg_013198 [Tegillarca granosa]
MTLVKRLTKFASDKYKNIFLEKLSEIETEKIVTNHEPLLDKNKRKNDDTIQLKYRKCIVVSRNKLDMGDC